MYSEALWQARFLNRKLNAYRPNVEKWNCTCPAFAISRFLICKHLIQCVHRVSPVFFLETNRFRESPFWRHESLQPLEEYCIESSASVAKPISGSHDENLDFGGERDEEDEGQADEEGEEEEEEEEERAHLHDGQTFEEALTADIDLIVDFAASLKHQVQRA